MGYGFNSYTKEEEHAHIEGHTWTRVHQKSSLSNNLHVWQPCLYQRCIETWCIFVHMYDVCRMSVAMIAAGRRPERSTQWMNILKAIQHE